MITQDKITEIFCIIDEFCTELQKDLRHAWIGKTSKTKKCQMSDSEIITIIILFQQSGQKCFKKYYLENVKFYWAKLFPKSLSYNRFVELISSFFIKMTLFVNTCCLGKCTGISYVDSTILPVCKNKRIKRHKVFKDLAQVGKSTMGWFFGFKLHLIITENGEIINFMVTPGNVDDRKPLEKESFLNNIFGKLFADKGYISKQLTEILVGKKIKLVTGIRNKMKNKLMILEEKILLRKRSIIETINGKLKEECTIQHTRHRSVANFLVNIVASIAAYQLLCKKPRIKL